MSPQVDIFDITYGAFSGTAFEKIRLETYGEDIGQFCWLTESRPPGQNGRLIEEARFDLEVSGDVTENMVELSKRLHDARARYRHEVVEIESEEEFESTQRFFSHMREASAEKRLSRFVCVAPKPVE